MFSNIYKGQTTGWYEFDKIIYGNASENLDPADGVLLGRYILLCYCETAFTEAEKLEIENETSSENLTDDKHIYWKNYDADGKISKDRMIYKKIYKDEKTQYIEIGRINEIKDNSLNSPGEKTPEGGEIFNDYENNQARTSMSSARGEGTVAGGKGFKILGLQPDSKNICPLPDTRDGINDISIRPDKNNGTFSFIISSEYDGSTLIYITSFRFNEVGTYTISGDLGCNFFTLVNDPYPVGYVTSEGLTFEVTENDLNSLFGVVFNFSNEYNGMPVSKDDAWIQVEKGSTKTEFEPHYKNYYKLYSIDGTEIDDIKIDDIYSVRIGNNYDNQGIIESIDKDNNTVTVTNFTKGTTTTLTNAYLWLPVMPEDWSTYDDPQTKTSLKATRKINAGTTYMDAAQYAEGSETYAIKYAAHAEGNRSVAAGRWSHAEGNGTYAAYGAHSEGLGTKAIGQGSHSEGNETNAKGYYSHSEGCITNALGGSSHSEGYRTTAEGEFSHAEGLYSVSIGEGSHAEGYQCKATGDNSHAEGNQTESSGKYSHAEGLKTKAIGDYSHSMGIITTAEKPGAFAGGTGSHALGNNSFAFGRDASALGDGAIAMGCGAQAQDFMNVAMGNNAIASGGRSISLGEYVTTNKNNQFAVGIYNRYIKRVDDSEHDWPVFMVGYGTSDSNRKNVFEVDRKGVATVGADPIDNLDVATKRYVDNSISSLNPTVDLSGYMPLTGGEIINEDYAYATTTINPDIFKINYLLTGSNSFIQMGADRVIGYDDHWGHPKFSGYIELSNEKCNEIPDSTFTITAIGVEGNNTAKASWRQWLGITTEDGSIDLSALENKITQLENKIKELENASPVLKE